MTGGGHMGMFTPADCRANNTAFLTSVAWCLADKCSDERDSVIQGYWEQQVTGSKDVPAKWSYFEALAEVDPKPPGYQLSTEDMHLNETSLVDPDAYLKQWNVLGAVYHEMVVESRYGIILVVLAAGLPILTTWLGWMPWVPAVYDRLKPYLLYPSTIGTYSVRPLPFLLGNAPTIGQGLFIFLFIAANVVLTSVSYSVRQPSSWFMDGWTELLAYLLYRTGAFAFALLPVIFLFSSRNNLLLWLSNWSHTTFMLLHRWVGRLFVIHAVLHSIFGLLAYKHYEKTIWWRWGAAATVLSVVLWFGSGLYVRRANYEIFLLTHIILTVVVLVGCWYHLILWYESMGMKPPNNTSGYEVWLYIAFAIWGFDRLVRVLRLVKSGLRRSKVTELGGSGYVRIDIPGLRWNTQLGKHCYVYFPTLSPLRPWENHPFSIIPTSVLQVGGERTTGSATEQVGGRSSPDDMESMSKTVGLSTSYQIDALANKNTTGITLFVKKSSGLTKSLGSHNGLLTLVEGAYHNTDIQNVLCCDRLLLIAGGIGITGVLPLLHHHRNVKLAWSVKEEAQCLIDEIAPAAKAVSAAQVDVRLGRRFDVSELINAEVETGWERVGVIVSGPGSLCDDVRATVAAAGRRSKTIFELEVDSYSW
ncbi:ferric reductase like transmembrane component domain-containing protein [Sarocladium implicatum]|nr:ferric reductase like transmembrane component domain-containing protein [Sarocladium implicatum]